MKISSTEQIPLKDKAYEMIKQKIIHCEFMPGKDISEVQIAEELGISRTPVREALLRLNQEKLVIIYPRKGIIVTPVTLKDIHEIYQIREMIEPYIAQIAYKNMSKEYLTNLKEKFKNIKCVPGQPSRMEYFKLDLEFHKYIVYCGKNKHLIRLTDEIYDLDNRIRVISTLGVSDIDRAVPEHIEIIDAFIDGNEERIKQTILQHLKSAKSAALMRV